MHEVRSLHPRRGWHYRQQMLRIRSGGAIDKRASVAHRGLLSAMRAPLYPFLNPFSPLCYAMGLVRSCNPCNAFNLYRSIHSKSWTTATANSDSTLGASTLLEGRSHDENGAVLRWLTFPFRQKQNSAKSGCEGAAGRITMMHKWSNCVVLFHAFLSWWHPASKRIAETQRVGR